MTKIRVHPKQSVYEAAKEAAKRNHWLVYSNGAVYEVIRKRPKNFHPGPTGPAAA